MILCIYMYMYMYMYLHACMIIHACVLCMCVSTGAGEASDTAAESFGWLRACS